MSNDIVDLKTGQYLAPESDVTDFGKLVFSKTKYSDPVTTGVWHKHEKAMLSMVFYGGNIEHRKNKKIERSRGSINFYHAHEIHKNDYKVFPSLHFGIELDDRFLQEYSFNEVLIRNAFELDRQGEFVFLNILKETPLNDPLSQTSAEMHFLSFLTNCYYEQKSNLTPNWMIVIRDILSDNWNKNLSLQQLGHLANIHPVTISKNFRRYFGCTYGEYVRKLRIQRAMDLIISGKHSLTQISIICGFSDQSHFIRVFKAITGHNPKKISYF